jgi:hypothetical protein
MGTPRINDAMRTKSQKFLITFDLPQPESRSLP